MSAVSALALLEGLQPPTPIPPIPLTRAERAAIARLEELGWTNVRKIEGKEWWLATKGFAGVANASPQALLHHVTSRNVPTDGGRPRWRNWRDRRRAA